MKSMTGFGCGNAANEKGAFTVEIKAVNSRFLEINMKGNYCLLYTSDAADDIALV